ncbi:SRPBCC family protein [Rubrobacter tropicus]|uniref:SRPBCC family protein n=1 Tax=Rubrobacter tropicus TaxID=2653851 RepID=UPI001A9F3383|nr:SRPBCC family protein [Rubrobacter tropicus]
MIPNDIDTQAPVVSRHGVVIEAPVEVLWRLHTDVDAWPTWQPDITAARLDGPFAPGSTFSWHTSGLDIESTVYEVEPERRTLWGGPAHGIVGIHKWTFTPVEGGTRVETAESWSGEPIEADAGAMQAALDGSLVAWLGHLQTAAVRDISDARG